MLWGPVLQLEMSLLPLRVCQKQLSPTGFSYASVPFDFFTNTMICAAGECLWFDGCAGIDGWWMWSCLRLPPDPSAAVACRDAAARVRHVPRRLWRPADLAGCRGGAGFASRHHQLDALPQRPMCQHQPWCVACPLPEALPRVRP